MRPKKSTSGNKTTPKPKRPPISRNDVAREDIVRSLLELHASKLAWLGEMAGGIAHEINNPLAVIHAYSDRLRDEALKGGPTPQQVLHATEKIEGMVQRIHRIITSLREMSTDSESSPFIACSLRQLIENTVSIVQPRRDFHGTIQIDPIAPDLTAECRSPQISQVLIHLILNAREAIKRAEQRWIKIHCGQVDEMIEIRVTDSGPGVPTHLRERIFDPFFSTGDLGAATGLGLPISRRVCELHGGSLQLDETSEFTTFVVRFPRWQRRRELGATTSYPSYQ